MLEIASASNPPTECCLCGSPENLTGEHKIKASLLRSEFGTSKMVVSKIGNPANRPRFSQSAKSREFHFSSRLCKPCNTARTQAADKEFDRFHAAARKLLDAGRDPRGAMESSQYTLGSEPYHNVFRYFAKLLCCHIADVGGPRFLALTRFALGEIDRNIVSLAIKRDWTFQEASRWMALHQYAAHGGLVVYGHKKTGSPWGFHSTLTIGPLQYVFFVRLNWIGCVVLRLQQKEFHDWCREKAKEAQLDPLTPNERKRLGFD